MAITAEELSSNLSGRESDEEVAKVSWKTSLIALLVGGVVISAYRWYQNEYSFTVGLDYFEPEFATYWMSLFYTQMTLIPIIGAIGCAYVWFTRPEEITMTPHDELKWYLMIISVLGGAGILAPVGAMLFMEADAAWHQVTIRDTDFTPTHIGLFYFAIPAALAGGAIGFLWVHTRMPDFHNRVSFNFALLLAGFFLIMPNLGFNEWGHTFFYAEELFAAPIHWGFVTLGWAVFGIGGFIVQMLGRVAKLTRVVYKQESEEILTN